MEHEEGGLEEPDKKYWYRNTSSFAVSMTGVGVGAVSWIVMYEWRQRRHNKRLCFEQLSNDDKFKFMLDVRDKVREIGVLKTKVRIPDFEIRESLEYLGFDMEDYL